MRKNFVLSAILTVAGMVTLIEGFTYVDRAGCSSLPSGPSPCYWAISGPLAYFPYSYVSWGLTLAGIAMLALGVMISVRLTRMDRKLKKSPQQARASIPQEAESKRTS